MALVNIPGIPFTLAGREYIIPPIALGPLEQLQKGIGEFTGNPFDTGQVCMVIDATFAALKRNYPDITRDQVADMIDVSNMAEVFQSVMDISGIRRKALEDTQPGE